MAKIKISQLTAKGSSLANTDLLPIAEVSGLAYITKRVTGSQVGAGGSVTLTVGTTAIASGTIGRVFFQGSGNVLQQSANLFWDNSNNRLGIGTASPTTAIDVNGTARVQGALTSVIGASTTNTYLYNIDITQTGNIQSPSFPTMGLSIYGTYTDNNTINNTIYNPFLNVTPTIAFGATGGLAGVNRNFINFSPIVSGAGKDVVQSTNILNITPSFTNRNVNNITGIYYNPTFTLSGSNNNHRAIETVVGNVIFNSTSGNVAIGGTSFGSSSSKVLAQYNGTAPGSSPADAFQMYSADVVGGNAAPHFRTENGNIIKIYQETTGIASATFVQNSGTRVDEVSTFDGYTIAQVVKALRNLGILA